MYNIIHNTITYVCHNHQIYFFFVVFDYDVVSITAIVISRRKKGQLNHVSLRKVDRFIRRQKVSTNDLKVHQVCLDKRNLEYRLSIESKKRNLSNWLHRNSFYCTLYYFTIYYIRESLPFNPHPFQPYAKRPFNITNVTCMGFIDAVFSQTF